MSARILQITLNNWVHCDHFYVFVLSFWTVFPMYSYYYKYNIEWFDEKRRYLYIVSEWYSATPKCFVYSLRSLPLRSYTKVVPIVYNYAKWLNKNCINTYKSNMDICIWDAWNRSSSFDTFCLSAFILFHVWCLIFCPILIIFINIHTRIYILLPLNNDATLT